METRKFYTMEDWHRDGVLKVKEGEIITDEVYYQLRDCVPPYWLGCGVFQVGEPYSCIFDKYGNLRDLYQTYIRVDDDDNFEYIGLRFGINSREEAWEVYPKKEINATCVK